MISIGALIIAAASLMDHASSKQLDGRCRPLSGCVGPAMMII